LSPYVGTNEENDAMDLRTNPFQGGGDDGRGLSITTTESQPPCHIGPITRAMARKLKEDGNSATNGRETYLYMLQEAKFLA